MIELIRIKKLQRLILIWADEKGILEKATPEKQFLKFLEETGELAQSILKQDHDEFVDAIGDVFVTIVIHAELCNCNIDFIYQDNDRLATGDQMRAMVDCVRPHSYEYAMTHLGNIFRGNQKLACSVHTASEL